MIRSDCRAALASRVSGVADVRSAFIVVGTKLLTSLDAEEEMATRQTQQPNKPSSLSQCKITASDRFMLTVFLHFKSSIIFT